MRFTRLTLSLLALTSLAACAHEAENTGMQNSSSVITMPGAYALQTDEAPAAMAGAMTMADNSPVTAGRISRYQRQVIVPGGMDGELTPCAKNFDAVMDHLEMLMAPQIEENNRIAAAQAADPRFKF